MILTEFTSANISICIQEPGKSKPKWDNIKSPAHEDCALLRSWNEIFRHYYLQIYTSFSKSKIVSTIEFKKIITLYHIGEIFMNLTFRD